MALNPVNDATTDGKIAVDSKMLVCNAAKKINELGCGKPWSIKWRGSSLCVASKWATDRAQCFS